MTYDGSNTIERARIHFSYVCERVTITECGKPGMGGNPGEPEYKCMTRRYDPCDWEKAHACDEQQ